MMKQIMTRAHAIAKTVEGNHMAKMSIALRQAWAEAKYELDFGHNAYGCGWDMVDKGAFLAKRFAIRAKKEARTAAILAQAMILLNELSGMSDEEACDYVYARKSELHAIAWSREASKEEKNAAGIKEAAYTKALNIYDGDGQRRQSAIGIYDTVGCNYGVVNE